jgi:hypothetical protein
MAKIRITINEDEKDIKKSSIIEVEEYIDRKWQPLGLFDQLGLATRAKKLVKALLG